MKGYLILENGKTFEGQLFGNPNDIIAEIVFNTSMVGYIETVTDKSYYGQIIVQSFPLIGNYGIIPEDFESSEISAFGYIVRESCLVPSNFRSKADLNTFFLEQKKVGLSGIDTRTLVKIIRESGVMNAMITSDLSRVDLEKIKNYKIVDAVKNVSCKQNEVFNENGLHNVVLWDFGRKENIVRELVKRDCKVICVPSNTTCEQILTLKPDGIMLSNGPGDPTDNKDVISEIRKVIKENIPIFGICLGHQLLALANNFSTEKLKYGHRGANQPVRDLNSGKVFISSQNHGYAVISESIDKEIAIPLFENVNDKTNEGIEYKKFNGFSVQFHPEASGGPRDTEYLFDKFIKNMEVSICR